MQNLNLFLFLVLFIGMVYLVIRDNRHKQLDPVQICMYMIGVFLDGFYCAKLLYAE